MMGFPQGWWKRFSKVGDPWRKSGITRPARGTRHSWKHPRHPYSGATCASEISCPGRFEIITPVGKFHVKSLKSPPSFFRGKWWFIRLSYAYHFTSKMNGCKCRPGKGHFFWFKPSKIWVPHYISGVHMRFFMVFPGTFGLDPWNNGPLWLEDWPHEGSGVIKPQATCTHLLLLSTAMFLRSQRLRFLVCTLNCKGNTGRIL